MSMYLKRAKPLGRMCQGDIFSNVDVVLANKVVLSDSGNSISGEVLTYNYCVALSQECDLLQDFISRKEDASKHDKYLINVLFAPAYVAEMLRDGTHLKDADLAMEKYNSARWGEISKNNNSRYHFLSSFTNYNVPNLVIDFKHMFTLSREYFYNEVLDSSYVASLAYLSRELLSQRFCNYLSRIGLPDDTNEIQTHFDAIRSGNSA